MAHFTAMLYAPSMLTGSCIFFKLLQNVTRRRRTTTITTFKLIDRDARGENLRELKQTSSTFDATAEIEQ